MPRFVPTDEQRHVVGLLAGALLSHDMIAKLVLNPRTERAINVSTLQKHFRDELDTGNTRLKAVILSAFYQLVRERDTNAVLFGMRALLGYNDRDPSVQLRLGDNAGAGRDMKITFVTPDRVLDLDDEPPQLSPPRTIDAKATKPSSNVPIVPLRRSHWMD